MTKSAPATVDDAGLLRPTTVGWHGKLPTRGDFVGRGLPRPWLRVWDDWLQRGMACATQYLGEADLRERLLAMTTWQCLVVPATLDEPVCCGVVSSSTDRVGRVFPLLVVETYPANRLDAAQLGALRARGRDLAGWLVEIRSSSTPKEFDAGLARWGETPWRADGRAGAGITRDEAAKDEAANAGTASAAAANVGVNIGAANAGAANEGAESTPVTSDVEESPSGDNVAGLRASRSSPASWWWRLDPGSAMSAPLVEAWPPRETLMLDWLGDPN